MSSFQYTEQDVADAFEKIPTSIQKLVNGEEISDDIIRIARKYDNIERDQLDSIIRECALVMLMIKPAEKDYYDFIKENFSIDKDSDVRQFSDDVNEYFDNLISRLERMMPRKTKDGDTTLWASENGRSVITEDYFKIFGYEEYPLSYVSSVHLSYMSGLNQPGSISTAIFGVIIALISFSMLGFSGIVLIFGVIGLIISFFMIRIPFKKSRPMGRISLHPNLGIDPIVIGWLGKTSGLSDQEVIDFTNMLRKLVNY